MPVESPTKISEPIKHLTHAEIRKRLAPYANRGWLNRFDGVEKRGQKFWLYVVRDFNIQDPAVELVVEDIVRLLEVKKYHKSPVRAEMAKLEAEGKLNIDTPEEEAKWEARLQEERDAQKKWEREDEAARKKQREHDIKSLEKNDDPELPEFKTTEIKGEGTMKDGEVVDSKVEEVNHATELSEEEKKQQSFVPKPPPEKEAPVSGPRVKSIESNGEEVYNADEEGEPKPKIETITALPKDAVERLKDIGINTVEAFDGMDQAQAKNILGAPLFTKLKDHFTS